MIFFLPGGNGAVFLAAYLAFTITISGFPASGFTIGRTRTTTLKTAPDLSGQESALLEVKNDLPKINKSKSNISQKKTPTLSRDAMNTVIASETPTRTSSNDLEVEKIYIQTKDMTSNEIFKPSHPPSMKNTTHFTLDNIASIINEENHFSTNIADVVKEFSQYSTPAISTNKNKKNSENPATSNTMTHSNIDVSQIRKASSKGVTDISSKTLPATETSPSTTTAQTLPDISKFENYDVYSTDLLTTDTTTTRMGSKNTEEKELVTEDINSPTETMTVEASSAVTKNPSWKIYTTIERKRTSAEVDTFSTEKSELLSKAETIPTKFTLENVASYSPIPSLNELRQELINNSKTYTSRTNAEAFLTMPEDQTTTAISALMSDLPPLSNSHTGSDIVVTSKRAGFLDLTIKQKDSNNAATTDSLNLNATESVGTPYEDDFQENDSLKNKNASNAQRQLVEDTIVDKLLEEQVLNDYMAKNYQSGLKLLEFTESNDDSVTEDSLSVKPISSKSTIYTVSPHYKKMKKIEIQPPKPFIRDPDDNSWRNESLSLLGIVFKAKNASKPFTQVLKNKTEAELNNIGSERDEKNEVTDLRERLVKIAEIRKSRKKKINKTGDTVYSDYEEATSGESSTTPKTETTLPLLDADGKLSFVGQTTLTGPAESTTTSIVNVHKEDVLTTSKKPPNINKFAEYYDTTDEYDADYVTLSKLDLKKFTTSSYGKDTTTPPSMSLTTHAKPLTTFWPDRKPTVQYFPPLPHRPKFNFNDYDTNFEKKGTMFSTLKAGPPLTTGTMPTDSRPESERPQRPAPAAPPVNKSADLFKNFYITEPSQAGEPGNRHTGTDDESFNRASYVIKHYKDLIDEAVKDDYDKTGEYVQTYSDAPLAGGTAHELAADRSKLNVDDYDYASNLRKDILNKFLETFNRNSERFKVDFPILYNSSVVHRKALGDGRVVASSSAFLKRQYGSAAGGCQPAPACELRVELAPAYELHYYVPDQEQRDPAEPQTPPLPYNY